MPAHCRSSARASARAAGNEGLRLVRRGIDFIRANTARARGLISVSAHPPLLAIEPALEPGAQERTFAPNLPCFRSLARQGSSLP
jgi:hypothetical protein